MATNYPINPRIRAYGKARLDIAGRATSPAEWGKLWKQPANAFPFVWGESWKQCVEYRVDDFPAEVGFFIDVLGLPINALDPGYAMLTSPHGDFYFSFVPTPPMEVSTPPNALRLQFMVKDILATTLVLQQRGIDFELPVQPLHPGATMSIASFRTPHGISIELWGKLVPKPSPTIELNLVKNDGDRDEPDDEDDDDFDLTEDESEEEEVDGQPSPENDGGEEEDGIESDADEENSEVSDGDDPDQDQDDDEEEDYDFDEDEDDDDDDDFDEDDSDGDEYARQKTDPPKNASYIPTQLHLESRPIAPQKSPHNLKDPDPEYVDLDVT